MGRHTLQDHCRDFFRTCSLKFGIEKNRSFVPVTVCELIDGFPYREEGDTMPKPPASPKVIEAVRESILRRPWPLSTSMAMMT